jgi:hypothetical protein
MATIRKETLFFPSLKYVPHAIPKIPPPIGKYRVLLPGGSKAILI